MNSTFFYVRMGAATLVAVAMMTTGAMAQVQSKGLASRLMPARSQGSAEAGVRAEVKTCGECCGDRQRSGGETRVKSRADAVVSCVGCEPKQVRQGHGKMSRQVWVHQAEKCAVAAGGCCVAAVKR